MPSLKDLKGTSSLITFAWLLGYEPNKLSFILYKIPNDEKYTTFPISKKCGGERVINAPVDRLNILQKKLARLLTNCYEDIQKKYKHKNALAHGFRKGFSIITNAKNHQKKRWVFNIDLQDFFPSINFGRVRGFFIKNKHFELNPKVATIIAQIACHNNELPQGSPCSPVISNFIGQPLDVRMANVAKKYNCFYSRYADDLTFSTNLKVFPEQIAVLMDESDNEWVPSESMCDKIDRLGFKINMQKVSMQSRTNRQIATGLIVNEKVNIKREYYKNARAMCHSLFETNEFYIGDKDQTGSINQLEGILSFNHHIKGQYNEQKNGDRRFRPIGIFRTYQRFLFYKNFYLTSKPVIICEGKTDSIYIKCALKQLKSDYPEFIEETDNKIKFKIKFFKFSKSFKELCPIAEGTSGLADLIELYDRKMKFFKQKIKNNPVIMLVDNDKGLKTITSRYEKMKNVDFDPNSLYNYFSYNLYIVPIPKKDSQRDTAIEDLFERQVLKTKINGKKFNKNDKIDKEKEYSKIVFAKQVILPKQNDINFDGFKEVLNRFKNVIEDYNKKIS
jgi:RNA-directed DNA polymerase